MGNLYTASIFLSLVSFCASASNLQDNTLLFLAYGSGSKAKVFSGKVQTGYYDKTASWQTDNHLTNRTKITFDQYVSLRRKEITTPLSDQNAVVQESSGITPTNKFERSYVLKS